MLSHLHFNRGQHLKGNCPKLWFQNTNILRDIYCAVLFLITQLCPNFCNPREGNPPGSSVHGDSPGKNTGVGFHALLQRIFPTLGLNPGLPHFRQILYRLNHQGGKCVPCTFLLPGFSLWDSKVGTSLVLQWLRLQTFNSEGEGSILGQGTKILHIVWTKRKKKK